MKHILEDPIFISLKSNEFYSLNCDFCNNQFVKQKRFITRLIKINRKNFFCSTECFQKSQIINIEKNCKQCNKQTFTTPSKIRKNKSGNFFCNRSCAATYNNTHKKTGTRKSKLEIWLESKLSIQYPELQILYTSKEAINSELDIYIPSLNLAFELNGIYHYEPIHGQDKLNQIQNNDHRKFQACLEKGIELCIIDTSQHTYVKERTNLKYLDIIKNIIDRKLNLVTE